MDISTKEGLKNLVVTSSEAINILGISRARLCQLNKSGKLIPIKKNFYYLKDIQDRKNIQEGLRNKFYRKSSK